MICDGQREAVFLGAGIHSALGIGIEANLRALQQAPPSPVLIRNDYTEDSLLIPYQVLAHSALEEREHRLYQRALEVAEQALAEAGLTTQQRRRIGLFVGSSSFDISVTEACFERMLSTDTTVQPLRDPSVAKLADYLVDQMGIRGEDYSFSTACTASANALMAASAQVQAGYIEHALVLGVELYNEVTALGFHSLGLLSQTTMKPFDAARDGLIPGEGVSALVIGAAPGDGVERFYLRGAANLSDSYSITSADPAGATIAAVMKRALEDANLTADQVDCVKVHGTASLASDEAEAAGMHRVFSSLPTLCAIKPFIGHTLGACGLNELILFYRALQAGFLVACPGICAVAGDLEVTLNQQRHPQAPGNFMLNYFGFGGNNTSLLISNKPPGL